MEEKPRVKIREDFNPRSPWGERLIDWYYKKRAGGFQSTLPVGGATVYLFLVQRERDISIHAPRGGSDVPQILPWR